MIPSWTSEGLLPAGIHSANREEVRDQLGWNAHRRSLILGLSDVLDVLARAGCTKFWLDGSFVTDKELPGDYDGCWSSDHVDQALLDPALLDFSVAGRVAVQSRYLGDVFIAGTEGASGLQFVEFFQQTRDGKTKGIVLLNPQETS